VSLPIEKNYLGVYTIFYENYYNTDKIIRDKETGKKNTYLKAKYGIEVYRYSKDKLAIMFITTNSSNNLIPQLESKGVKLDNLVMGDQESIYIFKEIDLPKVHSVVRFMIKGKNDQLKEFKLKQKEKKEKENK